MATATISTIDVEVRDTVKQEVVVLTLTKDEAMFLRRLVGHVAGSGGLKRRAADIREALLPYTGGEFTASPFIDSAPELRNEE